MTGTPNFVAFSSLLPASSPARTYAVFLETLEDSFPPYRLTAGKSNLQLCEGKSVDKGAIEFHSPIVSHPMVIGTAYHKPGH